jgi:hypothetical protein
MSRGRWSRRPQAHLAGPAEQKWFLQGDALDLYKEQEAVAVGSKRSAQGAKP